MKTTIIILFFILTTTISNAQLFENKYTTKSTIITETDTIECYLRDEDNFGYEIEYKLSKEDKNRETKKISIKKVISVKKSFDLYRKVAYNNKEYLMKELVNGEIKLYEHTSLITYSYHYANNNNINNNLNNITTTDEKTTYYIQKGDTLYKIRKLKKQKDLKAILKGCDEVTEMIEKLDNTLFEYNLKKIVQKYNFWLKRNKS